MTTCRPMRTGGQPDTICKVWPRWHRIGPLPTHPPGAHKGATKSRRKRTLRVDGCWQAVPACSWIPTAVCRGARLVRLGVVSPGDGSSNVATWLAMGERFIGKWSCGASSQRQKYGTCAGSGRAQHRKTRPPGMAASRAALSGCIVGALLRKPGTGAWSLLDDLRGSGPGETRGWRGVFRR